MEVNFHLSKNSIGYSRTVPASKSKLQKHCYDKLVEAVDSHNQNRTLMMVAFCDSSWLRIQSKHSQLTSTKHTQISLKAVLLTTKSQLQSLAKPPGGSRAHQPLLGLSGQRQEYMCLQQLLTFTCGIQVVGIGVVAKHRVKVYVETLRVVWLLGCWGACKPWRYEDKNCQGSLGQQP